MSYSLIMRLIVQQVRARGVRVRTWRVKLIALRQRSGHQFATPVDRCKGKKPWRQRRLS